MVVAPLVGRRVAEDADSDRMGDFAISLLGVDIDPSDRESLIAVLRAQLAGEAPKRLLHIATINPEYVMLAGKRSGFATALARSDIHTIDGVGVLFASRFLQPERKRCQRITGVDLVFLISSLARQSGSQLFLLGGKPGAARATATSLITQFPGLMLPATWDGGSSAIIDDAVTFDLIAAAKPDVLFVAYGAPGQVEWIERNRARLESGGVRIAVGIGGSFDAISGLAPRAPTLVQQIGLEWLYRLLREPWRWRRQLALPQFALLALRQIAQARTQRATDPSRPMAYPCRNTRRGSKGMH